jgi:predicted outer membrane repeat protein
LFISLGSSVTISKSIFKYGVAGYGGAIYLNGLSILDISDTKISNNYATEYGGAIYASGYENITITNT